MRRRRDHWYPQVPESYKTARGVVNPMWANHWKPRWETTVEGAHTANEQIVYLKVKELAKKLPGGGESRILHNHSVGKIAELLDMHVETVRNQLKSLQRKHSIVPWNVLTGSAAPRHRGDHGRTTTWLIPDYPSVLEARRADPLIGSTKTKQEKTCFWCFGPGRRFLTPEEVKEWGLDQVHDLIEKYGNRAALNWKRLETSPAAASISAPRAAVSPPGDSPPGPDPLPENIWKYLTDRTHGKCNEKQGKIVVSKGRGKAAAMNSPLSDEELFNVLKAFGKEKKGSVHAGYFLDVVEEKVGQYITDRDKKLAQRAADAPKHAAINREATIDLLVECLKDIRNPDPSSPALTETAMKTVAAADPEHLAEAERRMAAAPQRRRESA